MASSMGRVGRQDSMDSSSSLANHSQWQRPPSPTFSTTTTGSKVNLGDSETLISRKDLRASIACFEELMAAAKTYRNALINISSATAQFASAMEACSRVKGCRDSNAAMAGGAGLQYLLSNQEQLLADTVWRKFEIPLLEKLDNYKLATAERLASYEKSLHLQSEKIRKTEAENMKIGRRRKRDLKQFRSALSELQRQVDELDAIKLHYHEEVLEAEEDNWEAVLNKVAFVVRSQLDCFDKIAGKASDPVLEPLVMSIPDPFEVYGPPKEDGQIFSVLSPLGLDSSMNPPATNLTRISQPSSQNTSRSGSPSKLNTYTAMASLAVAQTSQVDVVGEKADAVENRAKRELSVIDERETASLSGDGDVTPRAPSPFTPVERVEPESGADVEAVTAALQKESDSQTGLAPDAKDEMSSPPTADGKLLAGKGGEPLTPTSDVSSAPPADSDTAHDQPTNDDGSPCASHATVRDELETAPVSSPAIGEGKPGFSDSRLEIIAA